MCEGVQVKALRYPLTLERGQSAEPGHQEEQKTIHTIQSLRFLSAKIQGGLAFGILTSEPTSYVWMVVKEHIYSHTWAAEQLDAFGILKSHFMLESWQKKTLSCLRCRF